MPKVICLYLDDSGTRNPDRKPSDKAQDWFALGGILIDEEKEDEARASHRRFCKNWKIDYPLHSSEIRSRSGNFSWLEKIEPDELQRFMDELTRVIVAVPVLGIACTIDRPGYDTRYREKHGRKTWMLCQTAFSVVCERAAKYALRRGRKLRVYPEASDRKSDGYIRKYYSELRTNGMPFSASTSGKYSPLSADALKATLYDLKFKNKTSQLAQLADLYLYPIAKAGYQNDYRPHAILVEQQKLINAHLSSEHRESEGIKYSCFDGAKGKQ